MLFLVTVVVEEELLNAALSFFSFLLSNTLSTVQSFSRETVPAKVLSNWVHHWIRPKSCSMSFLLMSALKIDRKSFISLVAASSSLLGRGETTRLRSQISYARPDIVSAS